MSTEEQDIHPVYKDLHEIAKKHNISDNLDGFEAQYAISKVIIGEEKHWHQISQEEASKILSDIQLYGFEEVQRWAEVGHRDVKTKNEIEVHRMVDFYDPESQQIKQITADEYNVTLALQEYLDVSTIITCIVLTKISDEERYKHMGYHSFKDYVFARCSFGERQAKRYLRIGRRLSSVFPIEGTPVSLLQGEHSDRLKELSSLGMRKLHKIASIPEDDVDLSRLPDDGILELKDGTEFDLEQIKEVTARQFDDTIDGLTEEIALLKKQIRDQEGELDELSRENQQIKREAEEGLDYKAQFDETATDFKNYERRISEAFDRAADLNKALTNIKDLPVEFKALVDRLQTVHQMVDRGLKNLRQDNAEALIGEIREEMRDQGLTKPDNQ